MDLNIKQDHLRICQALYRSQQVNQDPSTYLPSILWIPTSQSRPPMRLPNKNQDQPTRLPSIIWISKASTKTVYASAKHHMDLNICQASYGSQQEPIPASTHLPSIVWIPTSTKTAYTPAKHHMDLKSINQDHLHTCQDPNKSKKTIYASAKHRMDLNKFSKTAYAYAKHRMDPKTHLRICRASYGSQKHQPRPACASAKHRMDPTTAYAPAKAKPAPPRTAFKPLPAAWRSCPCSTRTSC